MRSRPGGPPSWWDWVAVGTTLASVALLVAAIVLLASGRWPLGAVTLALAAVVAAVPFTLVRRFTRDQRGARERMWRRLVDDLAAQGRDVDPIAGQRPRFRVVRGHHADAPVDGAPGDHGTGGAGDELRRQA